MKKILVLGAGLVARPLVRYLLNEPEFQVTVASRTVSKAEALLGGHQRGRALTLLANDQDSLDRLVAEHDLAISLLPASLHPVVAKLCTNHGKHMVTTSYVGQEMRALDAAAKKAGVLLLNELGVDPGIDHMSAMHVIEDVRRRGGTVTSFKSYCGGLPAPEACDNPWKYKCSWSPRAACLAATQAARFRQDGQLVDLPGVDLFTWNHPLHVEGVGELEAYPNRDSLLYVDTYGLEGIKTMFRGTLRYPGWSSCMKKVVDLGMLDLTPTTYAPGTTFAQWTAQLIGAAGTSGLRGQVAEKLELSETSDELERMEWFGLFSEQPLPVTGAQTTPLDIVAERMAELMPYREGERDMIVMVHQFEARLPDAPDERTKSTMVAFGEPGGDSAMARTVSLPAAVAAKLILTGHIRDTGVHIPVRPEIFQPILDELDHMGIRCEEQTERG